MQEGNEQKQKPYIKNAYKNIEYKTIINIIVSPPPPLGGIMNYFWKNKWVRENPRVEIRSMLCIVFVTVFIKLSL